MAKKDQPEIPQADAVDAAFVEVPAVAATPSATPAVQKLSVDAWAGRKGIVGQYVNGQYVAHGKLHYVAGAKVANKWDENYLVTEAEFDAAVDAAANIVIR